MTHENNMTNNPKCDDKSSVEIECQCDGVFRLGKMRPSVQEESQSCTHTTLPLSIISYPYLNNRVPVRASGNVA